MRFRKTAAATVAVLALGGLSACHTNVGTAAWVDGHRITESEVNTYLTPRAQSLDAQNPDRTTRKVAPRTVALEFLIQQAEYYKLLKKVLGKSVPSFVKLDAALPADIGAANVQSLTHQILAKGFSPRLVPIVLRVFEMGAVFQKLGIDVSKALRTLDFSATVNPRYGSWNAKTRTFDDHVVVPGYLIPQVGGVANP